MKEFHCSSCLEHYDVDLDEAQLSTQITVVNGKTTENRMYYSKCPNCGQMNTFESDDPKEWGNQKSPNVAKVKWLFGGSCLLTVIIAAVVLYFAGQGIVTIFDWLGK